MAIIEFAVGILGNLLSELISGTSGFLFQDITNSVEWKKWKAKHKLNKKDNDFLDIYAETLVELSEEGKPKELLTFYIEKAVINILADDWYSRLDEAGLEKGYNELAAWFTLDQRLSGFSPKEELASFLSVFRTKVNDNRSTGEAETHKMVTRLLKIDVDRKSALQKLHSRSTEVKSFINEYLGTPSEPVPFGGRADQLTELDKWLESPSPAYAIIAAQAGKGKSALLVNWSDSIMERDLAHVVFVPISIRFQTAMSSFTFSVLGTGLAKIYDEPLPGVNPSGELWRSWCIELLRRDPPSDKPLLVILDGLDEATDWEPGENLFPKSPPKGLRILVSARYLGGDVDEKGWLRRLGWKAATTATSITLPPLNLSGVEDILIKMGDSLSQLATNVDVVGEIFRLSEGDPLLINLYVRALLPYKAEAAVLQPEDLPKIRAGLRGFFKKWEEHLRKLLVKQNHSVQKKDVYDFFRTCATALGPLSLDDIAAIAGGALADSFQLEDVVQAAGRFIIGDGREMGFVFSHPRLRQYFQEKMNKIERKQWEERFLDYGRQIIKDFATQQMTPNDTPHYLIQFYGAHLERANAPDDDLFALTREYWLRAWESMEGTYAGFLNDIERVWHRVEAAPAPLQGKELAVLIKCALCRSSVSTQSTSISPKLLSLCVQHELLSPFQAMTIAKQTTSDNQLAEGIIELSPNLKSEALLKEAVAITRGIKTEKTKVEALLALIPVLPKELQIEISKEALSTASKVVNDYYGAELLTSIGKVLPEEVGPLMIPVIRKIKDQQERLLALVSSLSFFEGPIRAEIKERALHTVRTTEAPGSRIKLQIKLAEEVGGSLKDEIVQEIFTNLRKLPELPLEQWERSESTIADYLASMAKFLPDSSRIEALDWARSMTDQEAQWTVFKGFLPWLPKELKVQVSVEQLQHLRSLQDHATQANRLGHLLPFLPEEQKGNILNTIFVTLQIQEDSGPTTSALFLLLPYLTEESKMKLLQVPEEVDREMGANTFRQKGKFDSKTASPKSNLTYRLKKTIEEHPHWARSVALENLLLPLPDQLLKKVLELVNNIEDTTYRIQFLTGLLPNLSGHWKLEALRQALDTLQEIDYEGSQRDALLAMAAHLPQAWLEETLELLLTTRAFQSTDFQTTFASQLPEKLARAATKRIFAGARSIKDLTKQVDLEIALMDYSITPTKLAEEVLEKANKVEKLTDKVRSSTNLIPYFEGHSKLSAIREIIALLRELPEWWVFDSPRATAITRLAPHLQDPELFLEILEMAHGMKEKIVIYDEDFTHCAQAQALIGVAQYSPDRDKREITLKALEASRSIQNAQQKAFTLVNILPNESLSEEDKDEIAKEAIKAAQQSGYGLTLTSTVASLSPFISANLLEDVLENVLPLSSHPEERFEALQNIAPHLKTQKLQDQAASLASSIKDYNDDFKLAALICVHAYRYDPELQIDELATLLKEVAPMINSDWIRTKALSSLLLRLPRNLQDQAFKDAVDAITAMTNQKNDLLKDGLLDLAPLLPNWAILDPESAYDGLKKLVKSFSTLPRPTFLSYIQMILPFVMSLSQENQKEIAAQEIYQAVRDVSQWWP